MTKEALEDDWWVIGNVETGMYLHWKGDGISGCFVDVCDPEDAERYDTAEEASKAIQEDEDVQSEISVWIKPASPIHVKKGVIVSDEPEDGTPDIYSPAKRRARLLYCMDYLMHAMNDEEAMEPWLAKGAEDGLYQRSKEPPAEEYDGYTDMPEADFDEMVGLFIRTLALEGGFKNTELPDAAVGKAVLS